jgi:hypothetical protein
MRRGVALDAVEHRHIARLNSFNTKSLTLYGHGFPHSLMKCLYLLTFNARFQTELRVSLCGRCCIQTVNHAACAFIENKRYREEHAAPADVVNPKPGFVYQTDAILNLS